MVRVIRLKSVTYLSSGTKLTSIGGGKVVVTCAVVVLEGLAGDF